MILTAIVSTKAVVAADTREMACESDTTATIMRLVYDSQFDEALTMLSQMMKEEPNSMKWKFFRGVTLWRMMNQKRSMVLQEGSLENEMNELTRKGEELLRRNPQDTSALFYTGGAYGYLARYYAANEENFKAASIGKRGLSYHEVLISIAPTWWDTYLSLGLFHMYTSSVPWYLKPILFILGRLGTEEKAFEYLNLVAQKGEFARYEAAEALGQLCLRRKEYTRADSVYESLTNLFSRNLMYRWLLAVPSSMQGLYDRVIRIDSQTIELSLSRSPSLSDWDRVPLAFVYLRAASTYESLGDDEKAIETYQQLVDRRVAPRVNSWTHLCLGKLYQKRHEMRQAEQHFRIVVELNQVPQHVEEARTHLSELEEVK